MLVVAFPFQHFSKGVFMSASILAVNDQFGAVSNKIVKPEQLILLRISKMVTCSDPNYLDDFWSLKGSEVLSHWRQTFCYYNSEATTEVWQPMRETLVYDNPCFLISSDEKGIVATILSTFALTRQELHLLQNNSWLHKFSKHIKWNMKQ